MIYALVGVLGVLFALIMHHASQMLAVALLSIAEEMKAVRTGDDMDHSMDAVKQFKPTIVK